MCMEMETELEEEILDPRIAVELEKLNSGTDEINKLEKELDRANTTFRQLLNRTSAELESLGKKIGTAVEKARPFYEALAKAQNAHRACLTAAGQFQRANGIHAQAKALVKQAEIRNPKCLDSAWQEVLNHATMKVMEAEEMRKNSEAQHRVRAEDFTRAERVVSELERHLRPQIEKSRPFFTMKDKLNADLSGVKADIESLQKSISEAKRTYADSLKRLESISEEIHERRNERGIRTPGVGAERQSSCSSSSLSSSGCGGPDECTF